MRLVLSVCVCATAWLISVVSCANILAVIPTLSTSHYVGFEALIKELAGRGHNVTAITTFPQPEPVENLKEINVKSARATFTNNFSIESFRSVPEGFFEVYPKFFYYISDTEKILNNSDVLRIIHSEDKFDLIIYEMFIDDVFLGFAHKFNAPVIAMSSCYMFPYVADRLSIPANPSYVPEFYGHTTQNMYFYERLTNTFLDVTVRLFFKYFLEPVSTEVVRRYFGDDAPPVSDLVKNVSVYFINTHFTLFGAQPYPPQVVDVSGLQLKPAKPLPQVLDKWMNESINGVIYFSFGSMLRGSTLPINKVKAFLQVFETLPQRVLWKWEDDSVEKLPKNVKIMKWLPQRDILAHPRVKVFISHGGLLGVTEAIVSGVPILGVPIYGDQPNNVAALVEKKVALNVDYNNISVASLSYALNRLIHDKSYSENVKELSRRFQDRPMSPMDTAVYWTEYVLRHRGAPHLRSAAVHMPWYQYYLLDVIAVFIVAFLLILASVYYTIKKFVILVSPKKSNKLKSN